jgi:hypothetical protein
MTDQYAAGWYPDPAGIPQLRYFDEHGWTEQYAALMPTAWPPPQPQPQPQPSSMPVKQQARTWWKRKRVLIPAAAIGLLAINAANSPRPNSVATPPVTTIATQVLANELTSTVAPSSSTTAIPATTVTPTSTAAPTTTVTTKPTTAATTVLATTVPTTTAAVTEPPQVLPIAAQPDAQPPAAEPEAPLAATTARTTATAPVFYENCAAVRAAGAAPLRRGEPGYRDKLDGDRDGVACE